MIKYSLYGSDPRVELCMRLYSESLCVHKITGSGFYLIRHYAVCSLLCRPTHRFGHVIGQCNKQQHVSLTV